MDQIASLLQGGYAYLLIFQIVVVSSLFLLLISMVLKRMKQEALHFSMASAPSADGTKAEAKTEGAASTGDVAEWKTKFESLDAEFQKLAKNGPDQALNDKIKFLESKLLEYEILQEEISSLSNLKSENEKLKGEMLRMQASLNGGRVPTADVVPSEKAPAPAPAPTPETAAASAPTAEPTPEPTPAVPAATASELDGLLKEIDSLSPSPDVPKSA